MYQDSKLIAAVQDKGISSFRCSKQQFPMFSDSMCYFFYDFHDLIL